MVGAKVSRDSFDSPLSLPFLPLNWLQNSELNPYTLLRFFFCKNDMPLATAEMLGVPAKRTDSVSYAPGLLQYISSVYAVDTATYKSDCKRLDELRKNAVHLSDSLDQSTIERLFTYERDQIERQVSLR